MENCVKLSSVIRKNAIIFRTFYFNANETSLNVKRVSGRHRDSWLSVFLSVSRSLSDYRCTSQLHVAVLHYLSPVLGSVPRLLVRALCQGMNNAAPRPLAESQ